MMAVRVRWARAARPSVGIGAPSRVSSGTAVAAVASVALWSVYVFIQTVRHRDYFLPVRDAADRVAAAGREWQEDAG